METTRFETAMKIALRDLKKSDGDSQDGEKSKSTRMRLHAPKITIVLFEEIAEDSPAQSRTNIFDIDQYPEDMELYESIKARGVITPIVVRDLKSDQPGIKKRGDRIFALISGHRRVAAAKLAGLKGIPGIMARDEDDHELMTLAENMGRRELSTYERAAAVYSLKEDRGFSIRQTAKATGLSASYVSRMVSSFDAPAQLQELWKEESVSAATLEALKKHWGKFEEDVSKSTMSIVEKISIREAKELCDQLDLGMGLEPALHSIGGLDHTQTENKKGATQKKKRSSSGTGGKDEKTFKTEQKEAIIKALRGVFPNTKAEQLNALFDLAIATNTKDIEVLWAAGLYVSRGGKVDQALDNTSKALKDRKVRSLIKQEVKQTRKVSGLMRGLKRGDGELKKILQILFAGC
jgi:ParB/RepB/Spo0J family partition protein